MNEAEKAINLVSKQVPTKYYHAPPVAHAPHIGITGIYVNNNLLVGLRICCRGTRYSPTHKDHLGYEIKLI